MPQIMPIPALNDNYIWMILHPETCQALVVDPGEAKPVLKALSKYQAQLAGILITHHHWDHTNGIEELLAHKRVPVYGPANDPVALCDHPLQHDDYFHINELAIDFKVIEIPAHTSGHIAYIGLGGVFCGDTLFAAGCGRLFEGSAEQMLHSLHLLANLPTETLVYCAHEYTEANLRFALTIEPDNPDTQQRMQETQQLRASQQPTLPSSIELELKTNPFLRCHIATVKQAAEKHCGKTLLNEVEVFVELRRWKDAF